MIRTSTRHAVRRLAEQRITAKATASRQPRTFDESCFEKETSSTKKLFSRRIDGPQTPSACRIQNATLNESQKIQQ
jgi:hypothetical protein